MTLDYLYHIYCGRSRTPESYLERMIIFATAPFSLSTMPPKNQ